MNAAGIGQKDVGPAHQVDKSNVVQGRQEGYVGLPVQPAAHRFAHIRVRVNRIDDLDVVPAGEGGQGVTDSLNARAEALAPVGGDEDQPLAGRGFEGKIGAESAPGPLRIAAR